MKKMRKYDFANITVLPFPTFSEVANPYIFGGIKSVINVSEQEDSSLKEYYLTHSITYHHLPLKECVSDMGWGNIIECTKILIDNIKNRELP